MKKLLLLALLAVLVAVPAASATGGASVSVSPAAPVAGDSISFSGCGYKTNVNDYIYVYAAPTNNLGVPVLNEWVLVDAAGCFNSTTNIVTGYPTGSYTATSGAYTVTVHQDGTNKNATLDFTVG